MTFKGINAGEATFSYSFKDGKLILLTEKINLTNLSTKKADGFVGSVVGMYATSKNK